MTDDSLDREPGPEIPDVDSLPPLSPVVSPPVVQVFHPETGALHVAAVPFLVLLLDYLLYQGAGGLSYAILFILLPVAVAASAFRALRMAPVALFGAAFILIALRCAWSCSVPTVLVGAAMLSAFPVAVRLGRVNLPDILVSLPEAFAMSAPAWLYRIAEHRKTSRERATGEGRTLLRSTVLIPLGVCAAFGFVFVLSNPILQDLLSRWYSVLEKGVADLLRLYGPSPPRVIFWLCAVFVSGLLLRPVFKRLRDDVPWKEDAVQHNPAEDDGSLHFEIARNTLIGVNLLFLLYNGVDAFHLVIRDALPAGLNHSQYAHRGAFWLTVALAMTTFVIGVIFHGNVNFHERRKALDRWTSAWIAQNFVLAAWVFMRIHMYVDYNGLTRMRVVGLAGTALVVIGLVLVTVKAFRRRSVYWLVRKEFGAFLIACLVLAVLPVDYLVWRVNTPRILESEPPRTSVQLTQQPLSPEGLAVLPPLLEHPDPVIAEGAAALLGRWYFGGGRDYADGTARLERWTQYQRGDVWCARVLAGHEARILLLVPDRNWDAKIEQLKKHTARWI